MTEQKQANVESDAPEISIEQTNETEVGPHVEKLSGRIDASKAPELRRMFERMIDDGTTNLIIDLSETGFMDSAGLAVLVSAYKRARKLDGSVRLVKPQSEGVSRILSLTKFDRVFDIDDSVEDAVKAFS